MAPRRRPRLFFALVLILLFLVFVYVGMDLISIRELPTGGRVAAWSILAVSFGNILWLPLVFWNRESDERSPIEICLQISAFLNMAMISFLLFFLIVRDTLLIAARFAGRELPLLENARGSILVIALAIIALVAGNRAARAAAPVKRVEVPLKDLDRAFDGFRIVQISDLHVGPTIRRNYVSRIVERVNELHADLIAVTGDLVDGMVPALAAEVEPLRELQAAHGVAYVTGNHEYYWDGPGWIKKARELGFRVLMNDHLLLERGSAQIAIGGIPDPTADQMPGGIKPDLTHTRGSMPENAIRILLVHQPGVARLAAKAGFHLQLSGHTHGGQFVPWIWVARRVHEFSAGLHRSGEMWIYVSRGTGYWGPPVRLGAPSEITEITLRSIS